MTYKRIIYTILVCLFLGLSSKYLFAQQAVSEVTGSTNSTSAITDLNQKEQQREETYTNLLKLNIPTQTNNPSLIVTFTDPSEQKSGVQVEIDGKSFTEIKSPYTLPALSIGQHILKFKFVDDLGSTQLLEKTLIVLPRAPIINAPDMKDGSVVIYGTGLPNSEIILIVSSGINLQSKQSQIDPDGKWSFTFERGELVDGTYSITAYTRRYGYSSDPGENITFLIGEQNSTIVSTNANRFSFKNIELKKLSSFISENPDILILCAGCFVLGFVLSFLLSIIFKGTDEKKKLEKITKQISKPQNGEKELTLKERLTTDKKDHVKQEEKQKPQEERSFAKIDFLRDFKNFDPDNHKGEEKPLSKKRIKVSLTSKRDDS